MCFKYIQSKKWFKYSTNIPLLLSYLLYNFGILHKIARLLYVYHNFMISLGGQMDRRGKNRPPFQDVGPTIKNLCSIPEKLSEGRFLLFLFLVSFHNGARERFSFVILDELSSESRRAPGF